MSEGELRVIQAGEVAARRAMWEAITALVNVIQAAIIPMLTKAGK